MGSNKSIKAIACIFLFILSAVLFSKCEEETAKPRDYPRVKTNPVSNITEKGATFNAEIYSLGTEAVINHGFVWGLGDVPTLTGNKILLGPYGTTGTYSADVQTTLVKDQKYTVKPFVQTADHLVYGPSVAFISLGSGAPVINGFEPDSAAWMDTLIVKGKNFSWKPEENIVKLNQIKCAALSSTDTTLTVLVNYDINVLKSVLSVELAGNVAVHTKDTFRLIPPVLIDYYPKQARWGDTIYLRGRLLAAISSKTGNYIKIGSINCLYLKSFADSTIAARVPYEINTVSNNLTMLINGFNFIGKEPFQLLSPSFIFAPNEATWGNTISLTGTFNTITSRNSVFFDDVQATIVSSSASILKIQVPAVLSKVKTNIIYKASPFSVTSADTFRLKEPVIKSFSPSSGPGNAIVTIKGKYFSIGSTTVVFGNASGVITTMNDSTINVRVPTGINGPVKISVTVKLQTIISSEDFIITNPKISSVYPLSGTFNDEVTINGENFIPPSGSTTVSFSGIPATVKSLTATAIVVSVPLTMDSIPSAITVTAGSNSISSLDKFILNSPVIVSVSPLSIAPGQDITINGLNFNPVPANNHVYWDIYPLAVKSATATEIIATLPNYLPRGNYKIKINIGGYARFSSQEFSINSQWLRIPAPKLLTNAGARTTYGGMTIYGEAPGSLGYLCSPASNVMYKFDPSDKTWTKLNTSTPFYLTTKMGEVVCKDTFYLISGHDHYIYDGSGGMFAFNEISNKWGKINTPLNGRAGVAFSLNNKIYFGLDYWSGTLNDLWECDPGSGYSWTRKSNIPVAFFKYYSSYFSLADKGYVLFSDNIFWQYDPISDVWTKRANFPGPARELAVSFVIGEYAYFGTGISGSTNNNDIWRYDAVSDSWSLISNMPNARNSGVAFVINNKAYIGYGVDLGNNQFSDFYEFDPNYPLK